MRLITPSLISDKYKVTCSVAKKVIKFFASSGKCLPLDAQSKQLPLYTGCDKKELTKEEAN